MKITTLLRVGQVNIAARWFGLLVIAGLLLGAVSLQAAGQTTTKTLLTTLGGGRQYYNPNSYYGSSNSVYGTLYSQFHTPSGISLDWFTSELYVADRDNNTVRYLDLLAGQTYTFAPWPGLIPASLISHPVGVAVDASGNVYVLNRGNGTNGTVVEIDYYGDNYITNMTRLTNASGIALDTVGDIFVTASNNVFRITPAGVSNLVVKITAPGASLQGIVMKRSGTNAGLLAVCDSGRNGIYLINPTNGVVTTNAGFNGVGDNSGINNRGIANSKASFFQPSGLAEAGDGSLIFADLGNQRVKVVAATGYTTNLYGVASNYWWGVSGSLTPCGGTALPGWSDCFVQQPDVIGDVQARQPFALAIGPDGTLYTTELYYHIIRQVTGANIVPPLPWPPPKPTGLIATQGYGQVILNWNQSSGATSYNVKRSTTSSTETTIASTTGTSYTDTNVVDETTYYYVVSALNTGGEGQNSDEASARPMFSPAPTNLVVTATNFTSISLAWSPSAGATSYNLKRSTSSGTETTIASIASPTLNYQDATVDPGTTYYYVVTAVNHGGENPTNSPEVSVRVPIPPPPPPVIGWFDYEGVPPVSVFYPVGGTPYITHNDKTLAIEAIADGVSTLFTDDGSDPGTNGTSPPSYQNGSQDTQTPLPVTIAPDLIIKAVNTNAGGSSATVTAEFIFQVGSPSIVGNNAAQFVVNDETMGANLRYTTDGTDPRTNGAVIGPVSGTNGFTLSLQFPANTNSMLFQIIGIKAHYQNSSIASRVFSLSNFVPNAISFGFASGEASSDFVASPGQTFYAPVTLTTLPGTVMYSLQFNLTVNPGGTNPGPALVSPPAPFNFVSMLMKPIPGTTPVLYTPIPPWMFTGTAFTNLVFTNLTENLLGVGWVERAGATNLYDTTKQTLIKFSIAHDDMFPPGAHNEEPNGVIVGGYSFQVPVDATDGQTYQIQIGRPSATSDGIGTPGSDVYIAAPTNGSLGGGAINATKNVTVANLKYLVGNVYNFHWFNAGDFGNTNLQDADVEQVFESAIYGLNTPPPGSDFFDAMDSCGNIGALDQDPADENFGYYTNAAVYPYSFTYTTTNYIYTDDINTNTIAGTSNVITHTVNIYIDSVPITAYYTLTTNAPTFTNVVLLSITYTPPTFGNPYVPALFDGNDLNINQIAFGDGILDVCDVYVTYRRSLDTNSLVWFQRFWTNGVRVAMATNAPAIQSKVVSAGGKFSPLSVSVTNKPFVNFSAGDLQTTAGQQISIPITASVLGIYPLRVAMLNISVVPLDGSPVLTSKISFTPGTVLGTPYKTDSVDQNNYAAVWLNSAIAGISNNATIGWLNVPIPASANSSSAYAVHFDHASGSPNGLGSFPKQTWTGLITLSSRTNSSYNDGISDSWRLRWFGTINNLLSVSNACPSGDGVNNWKKYVAGVDPYTSGDFPSLNTQTPVPSGATAAIYWPTVSGKQYAILSSASLFPGKWTTNCIVTGNGGNMEYDDPSAGAVKFYRVLILP